MTEATPTPGPGDGSACEQLAPIVLVTGGSEGIGLALAERFARAGHAVAIVARGQDRLARVQAALRATGATAVAIVCDLTSPGAPLRIEAELAARGYYADILINNAGIGLAGPLVRQPTDDIARLIALNVAAATELLRHFLPAMIARRRGGVLNVASLGGYAPGPQQAAYYASKAFILSLSEAVAWEARGTGVHVAVLAPGPVRTRFHARMGTERAFYRWLMPSMSPTRVAAAGYWGFRLRRLVIVPGLVWPMSALLLRGLPHRLLLPILSWLLRPPVLRAKR